MIIKNYNKFGFDTETVIIGAGMSGLYFGQILTENSKDFIILEKNDYLGGRTKMDFFNSVQVPTGAAYARVDKDKILMSLLNRYKIKQEQYELKMDFKFNEVDINKAINKLKRESGSYDRSKLTFDQFSKKVLKDDYSGFMSMMGYTDFKNADLRDTVLNYGLDDNTTGNKVINVDWNSLSNKMMDFINPDRIKLKTEVTSIERNTNSIVVNFKDGSIKCKNVVLATTKNAVESILGKSICKGIESQEFIKIFAQCDGLEKVRNYTVVNSELRKIVPVKSDVYCVAFSDNEDAMKLKNAPKKEIQKILNKDFQNSRILKMQKYWWQEGTHYFTPLSKEYKSRTDFINKIQRPDKNIFIIGEMVAKRQGWVEGALSTVEKIIDNIS